MAKHKRPTRPLSQKKSPLTHFLCLPLVTPASKPQLEASLAKFKNGVTQEPSTEGLGVASATRDETVAHFVHPKAVRPVGALHCTLGIMSLKEAELKEAIDLLNGLDLQSMIEGDHQTVLMPESEDKQPPTGSDTLQRPVTPPPIQRSVGPLSVDLKGLQSMHAPQKTSILYIAPSDPRDRLYKVCLALQKTFKDKGLVVEDNRALKLHATIVNTVYAKGKKRPLREQHTAFSSSKLSGTEGNEVKDDRSFGHGPNADAPLKIDATQILEQYKDYVWAENASAGPGSDLRDGRKEDTR